jgi:hypothetical protein
MSAARKPVSVPLAERRAELRAVQQQVRDHMAGCPFCQVMYRGNPSCTELAGLRADAAAMQKEIRTWFDPGSDDVPLFDSAGRTMNDE